VRHNRMGHRRRMLMSMLAIALVAGIFGAPGVAASAPAAVIAPQNDVASYEAICLNMNASFDFIPLHQLALESAPYDFQNRLEVESVNVSEVSVGWMRVVLAQARTKLGLIVDAKMEVSPGSGTITFSRNGQPEIRVSERYGIPIDREKAAIGISTLTIQFEFLGSPEKNCMIVAEPLFPDASGMILVQYRFVIGRKTIEEILCPMCVPSDDMLLRFVTNVAAAVRELDLDTTIMLPALIGALASHDVDIFHEQLATLRTALIDPPTGGGEDAAKFPWTVLICVAGGLGGDLIAALAGTGAMAALNTAAIAAAQ